MKNLEEIIQNSKRRVSQSFFKIVKNGNEYSIIKYFGPKKSLFQMMSDGWRQFDGLKNEINESYPVFDINDFKAVDERTIIKKSENDLLKEELTEFLKYFELSNNLYNAVKNLKNLLNSLSIKYMEFEKFSDLQNAFTSSIKSNSIEGSRYLTLFSTYVENIYLQLEKIKVSSPRDLFDKKFNYFLAFIK